jgi:hypothetical protein
LKRIIVETANRFARDLIVQETGHRMLKAQGIEIIATDSPAAFVEDTPTATLVRQVLGAVAQFDKAMAVAKLRLARDRIRKRDGKCEGRKSHAEERPEVVALARQLHKRGMDYRAIGAELERAGRGLPSEIHTDPARVLQGCALTAAFASTRTAGSAASPLAPPVRPIRRTVQSSVVDRSRLGILPPIGGLSLLSAWLPSDRISFCDWAGGYHENDVDHYWSDHRCNNTLGNSCFSRLVVETGPLAVMR